MRRLPFQIAIFLAASLLFLGEPIAAKQLLPAFGGSAAVWMTCLVFFQAILLAGYLYAHLLTRNPPSRWQITLHFALLAIAAASAIAWAAGAIHNPASQTHPVTSIFLTLALRIGAPFLLLGSTSPLLQVWLARRSADAISYRLFALSNLASLLALLSYPTLIEPHLRLTTQRILWATGVGVFALVSGGLALNLSASNPAIPHERHHEPHDEAQTVSSSRSRLLWFLLPLAASMQLAAVTAHLTTNIAAIPLLWILPLAVYLITFILAFHLQLRRFRGILLRFLAVLLAALGYILAHTDVALPIGVAVAFFLAELFLAALFCHSETCALRPARASESTLFYLILALGGACGSFLIGIAAPLLFSGNYDLALSFLATALLAAVVTWPSGWPQRLLWTTGSALLVFLVVALHAAYHHETLLATRNFYGSLRVRQTVTTDGATERILLNGSIEHGSQIFSPELARTPTTYYAENSGVGLALRLCCLDRSKNIGVIGLGVGTLAAYGIPGDRIRFYEINPSVRPIADHLFTYLRDSGADITFAQGDARASLAAEPPHHFDVLVIDAFSGDAIPLHLLTVEALALYRRHLALGGILAFHVSNQYVDLAPELARLAAAAGMQARAITSEKDDQRGAFKATWVLLTADAAFFDAPEFDDRARTIAAPATLRPWTDDYSSLLPLLRW